MAIENPVQTGTNPVFISIGGVVTACTGSFENLLTISSVLGISIMIKCHNHLT